VLTQSDACPRVFVCVNDVYARCDCCEAMHACVGVCFRMQKAHAHGDCCQAMHVSVFGLVQGACSL